MAEPENSKNNIKLESLLLKLESQETLIREVARQLAEPGQVQMYPLDLVTIAVMNRTLSNIFGFTSLIRQQNYSGAAAIVRLHLDSLLRLSACWIYSKPHELAMKVLAGERIDKLKDGNGHFMTDRYLAEQLSLRYSWILPVYQSTSGYIHLSQAHISLSTGLKNRKDNTLSHRISRFDDVTIETKLEAAQCMLEITNIQLDYLKGWNYTKRNPEEIEQKKHMDVISRMSLQNDFSQSGEVIEAANERLPALIMCFKTIKDLLENYDVSDTHYNTAFQSFLEIFDCLPLMATKLPEQSFVVRARANSVDEIFSRKTEISYNSDSEKVSAGRFNAPKSVVFYGALPIPGNELDFSFTSCLESCKGLISKEEPVLSQQLTIGIWRLNQVLPVINLCFDEKHLKTNIPLKIDVAHYRKQLKKYYAPETYEFFMEFLVYFSELSRSNNSRAYYILTALFHAAQYYYESVMDVPMPGVIYPSAATEGIGLNVVLVPGAVNECLNLEKVGMYQFSLKEDAYTAKPCCELANVIDDQFFLKISLV